MVIPFQRWKASFKNSFSIIHPRDRSTTNDEYGLLRVGTRDTEDILVFYSTI